MKAAIDDDDLDVTADHVLVLRNAGPQGGPGMPEWGMLPIPKKLLKQGVRDMLRISDARMSGTSYGACILHVAPEAYVGGPLALVRTGDIITVDVPARTHPSRGARRGAGRAAAPPGRRRRRAYERGYGWMFSQHIRQADEGCDFDFLETSFGAPVGEPTSSDGRLTRLGRGLGGAAAGTGRSSRPSAWRAKRPASRACTGSSLGHGQPPNWCAGSRRTPAAISACVFITNGPYCTTGSPIGRPCSSSDLASPRRPSTSASTSASARSSTRWSSAIACAVDATPLPAKK